jgi:hypothetical protein
MDICEKLRWMADKHCNELIEAAEEIERLREERKSYSAAVESLDAEVTAQRRAANEHRNAAMEADLRTQAAVRGENLVRDMMQTIISIAHDGSLEKGDRLQRIAVRAAKILCANPETPNAQVTGASPALMAKRPR